MTEAERANLHMLETWPRERIRTHHEAAPKEVVRGPGRNRAKSIVYFRRQWIKKHFGKMSQNEMAKHLEICSASVSQHVRKLGLSKRGPSRKKTRSL